MMVRLFSSRRRTRIKERSAPSSASDGFTLLEAMAAVLLMSVILAFIAIIVRQWFVNWNRGVVRLQDDRLLAVALDRISGDLAAAEFVSTSAVYDVPLFEGDEHWVIFVRSTLSPNDASGLQVVRLAELADVAGPLLVRSTAPPPIGVAQVKAGEFLVFSNPVALLRAPYQVFFSYAGDDRMWRDDWHGQPRLPRAVRVRIQNAATGIFLGMSASTLVHAELPTRCVFAMTDAQCPELPTQAPRPNPEGATSGNQ
jgi:general secretion pathway protein J